MSLDETLVLRVPADLKARIVRLSEQQETTLNALFLLAMHNHLVAVEARRRARVNQPQE